MAKRVSLNDRESPEENKYSKAVSAFISSEKDVNKSTDVDVSTNVNDDVNVNTNVNVNVDKDVNTSVNNFVNTNVNKIVLIKKEKKPEPKRSTYYLLPSTIQKIDKLAKATGIGKSTLVQQLLDQALDLIELE